MDYANLRKSPTSKERRIVVEISRGLYHFWGMAIFCSIHSTIFIAGKAIKISITILNTSVMTISVIFYIP